VCQSTVGCALIIGGVDIRGPQVVCCDPNGYVTYLPYYTMGSGSLGAMAVLESKFKDDMTQEEAIALVVEAVQAGIYFDLGSGSRVDIAVVTKDKGFKMRSHDPFTKENNKK